MLCASLRSLIIAVRRVAFGFAIASALLSGSVRSVIAADAVWTAGTGSFDDVANWDTNAVPVNGDVAIINNGGTAELTVAATTSGATLRIGLDGTGAMTVSGTGTYETSGDMWIGRTQRLQRSTWGMVRSRSAAAPQSEKSAVRPSLPAEPMPAGPPVRSRSGPGAPIFTTPAACSLRPTG